METNLWEEKINRFLGRECKIESRTEELARLTDRLKGAIIFCAFVILRKIARRKYESYYHNGLSGL